MTIISPGDIVIIDDCDSPQARLCAVVISIKDGVCYALYLTKYTRNIARCWSRMPTKVEDFGVKVEFDGDSIRTVMTGDSTATYPDGLPRKWQDRHASNWYQCRPKALAKVSKRYTAREAA